MSHTERTRQENKIETILKDLAEVTNRKPLYKELIIELKDYKQKYGRGYLPRRARGNHE